MLSYKNLLKTLLVAGFAFSLAACDDGGAENAGEKLDEAVNDAGNAVEDTCEDVKEGMKSEDEDC
ncbi:hypothetical protein [Salinimonas sediminis]|uniref:YtxH domain-containing protein n=1 Tax=Salinimonas sediminis TaxID=2303538 RepID=A0A346NN61_9ALTE|nr:hypothetical protein [Salinimonas sediminis]AXR06968.1 hypothetical protein D0Y50_11760 [Salinimonas sediminis]